MMYAKLLTYSALLYEPKNFCGWVSVKYIRHAQAGIHLLYLLLGMQAPWTEIGRLQSDVSQIKNQLHQMAQSHEVHQITRNVDSLECTVQEISSASDGIRTELETLREEVRLLREELIPTVN
jgi:hypothetical protein